jgi:outer membrane receptor protein involved in Fe transport
VDARPTLVTNPIDEVDSYLVANLHLRLRKLLGRDGVELSLAVNNLFDQEYYHPGVIDAGAGEDVSQESLSWYSSRLPQPGRNFTATLKTRF